MRFLLVMSADNHGYMVIDTKTSKLVATVYNQEVAQALVDMIEND